MAVLVDIVVLVILAGAALGGWRSGFFSTLGGALGLALAVWLLPYVLRPLDGALASYSWHGVAVGVAGILLLVVGAGIGSAVALPLRRRGARSPLRWVGRALGLILAVAVAAVIIWVLMVEASVNGPADLKDAVEHSQSWRVVAEQLPGGASNQIARLADWLESALVRPSLG